MQICFVLICRLIGILSIALAPVWFYAFNMLACTGIDHQWIFVRPVYFAASFVSSILALAYGIFLISKAKVLAGLSEATAHRGPTAPLSLQSGMALLGLFGLLWNLPSSARAICLPFQGFTVGWDVIVADVVGICLSLVLVLKSRPIADFILKHQQKKNRTKPSRATSGSAPSAEPEAPEG